MGPSADCYLVWMLDFSAFGMVGESKYIPSLFQMPAEILLLIKDHLRVPDKVALSYTCRAAYWSKDCLCCTSSPCKPEVDSELDYIQDLDEARRAALEDMCEDAAEEDWHDYIDWEAE